VIAGVVHVCLAWLIERLVLRHLVNQEGTTLLMATLGIAYFLEGFGSVHFRQRHLQDRHRHAQRPGDGLGELCFEGGVTDQPRRLVLPR
jgi:branched-chain amino acid transport system permease protein